MANRSDRGRAQPAVMSRASRARKPEWNLVRGNHQGQRFMPRKQAGHKTAPDQRAKPSQIPCNAGAIHTGPSLRKVVPADRGPSQTTSERIVTEAAILGIN